MFSKPIVIAASVATAQAALMAQGSAAYSSGTSVEIGCGQCMELTDTKWISKDAAYGTIAAAETVAVNSNKITGYICCKDATTKEDATNATFCAAGTVAANGNVITPTAASGDYFAAVLAQCPHQKDNCTAAGKKADGTTALTISDDRMIELAELKESVTLTLKVIASPGTAPALKQRKGDVCTWVVKGKCDAPVLTVPKTSGALTSATPEWKIQITEWSAEFTPSTSDAQQGATWTANVGATGKLYYPPLQSASVVTDLQATAVVATAPNNIMGEVGFNLATGSSEYAYSKVPGGTLNDWIDWVKSVYTSYDAEVVKYEVERKAWKTYAEYKAPAPGLFGPTADPDAPKTMSSPRQPTQPVDVPTTIKNLADKTKVTYNGKAGFGWPSAMMITPVKEKTVRPWGVLAGGGQLSTTSTAATATDSTYSMRKTTNKDSAGKYITSCDASYLMITGWL